MSSKPTLPSSQEGSRYTTDFNTILSTGFFNAEGTPANSPGGSYGQLIVARGIDTGLQIYGGYNSDQLWFRGWASSGSTWYSWRKVWHGGNDGSGSGLDADLLDGISSASFSQLGSAIEKGEMSNSGTLSFDWGNSEVSDTLTIGASGSVSDSALSGNVSLLGSAIEKGEISNSGTLSFDWTDSEVANSLTNTGTLDGFSATTAGTGSTIAARDSSGDINTRLFRSEYDSTNATINFIMTQIDTASNNYIRPSTPAQLISALNLSTGAHSSGDITGVTAGSGLTGGGSSGTVTLNVGAGTGISVAADSISATLGTSITSGEISNNTIQEADLEATNAPTNNYILSYDSGTAGFTWVVDANSGGDITGITNGTGISGGCASGTCTLSATLGTAIEKGEISNSGTLSFDWANSEVSDTLTIGASGSVSDSALSGNVSLLGTAIEKGEISNSGTLSFDWTDAEVANSLTNTGTLDGFNGSDFLRSNANDNLTAAIIVPGANRDEGIFGTYDSYKTQHIWSMGTAYRNSAAGTNFGGLYGLAYKHTNNTTGGTMAGGHQMVWAQAGTGTSAMGTNLWTSGTITSAGGSMSGMLTVTAAGTDITAQKINAVTVDPVYTIGGIHYATYMAGMTGVKEETTGVIRLQEQNATHSYVIDFNNLEQGSDVWLFAQTINIDGRAYIAEDGTVYRTTAEEIFDNMTVLLTPGFEGDVWYEKDVENKRITILADKSGEVSYRLTAPRLDWKSWSNYSEDDWEGLNLDKLLSSKQ